MSDGSSFPPFPATLARDSEAARTPGMIQLGILLAGGCLSVLGGVLVAPVLLQMQQAFANVAGVAVLVPVVLTIPGLLVGLTAPFAGLIVDRVDRKRLLIVALVAYALAGTAPVYLASLPAILFSRVLVGMCEAAIVTCCTTLIGDYWSGARRSRYLSLQTVVGALSATVFLALGGLLGTSGWRTPFWLYTLALVLVPLVSAGIWQPGGRTRRADGGRLEPLPWRQLLAPYAITFVGGVVFCTLIVELSYVFGDSGVSSSAVIGGVGALMAVATAAGGLAFARLCHRTARSLLPTSFGVAALGFGLVFAAKAALVITAGAIVAGLGTGLLLPVLLTWTVNRLDFQQRGRGTGLWLGTLFIGEFLCPLVISAITAAVGGLRPAIGVMGIVAVAMAAFSVLATRRNNVPLSLTTD